MESMYDKLGELISGVLEKGTLPHHDESVIAAQQPDVLATDSAVTDNQQTAIKIDTAHINQKSAVTLKYILRTKQKNQGEVIHAKDICQRAVPLFSLPTHIQSAYDTLGITANASEKELHSAYREKLKLFHPDSNSENKTVQHVAHKKTEEIIAAYTAITAWRQGHSK